MTVDTHGADNCPRCAAMQALLRRIPDEIRVFQDIQGWLPGESRNKLVCDIARKIERIIDADRAAE